MLTRDELDHFWAITQEADRIYWEIVAARRRRDRQRIIHLSAPKCESRGHTRFRR